MGPPAATSKERGLASWDTRAPDGCGKFISPTGEGRGKAAGPGRGRCERPGDLGESPGGHQRAASPISPPGSLPESFPPWRPHWSVGALTPIAGRCCPVLPQVAARVVLVVVFGLRMPEQHGWGSRSTGRGVAPSWTRRHRPPPVHPKTALEPEHPAGGAFYGPRVGVAFWGVVTAGPPPRLARREGGAGPHLAELSRAFPGARSWPLPLGTRTPSLRPTGLSAPTLSPGQIPRASGRLSVAGVPRHSGSR